MIAFAIRPGIPAAVPFTSSWSSVLARCSAAFLPNRDGTPAQRSGTRATTCHRWGVP